MNCAHCLTENAMDTPYVGWVLGLIGLALAALAIVAGLGTGVV